MSRDKSQQVMHAPSYQSVMQRLINIFISIFPAVENFLATKIFYLNQRPPASHRYFRQPNKFRLMAAKESRIYATTEIYIHTFIQQHWRTSKKQGRPILKETCWRIYYNHDKNITT